MSDAAINRLDQIVRPDAAPSAAETGEDVGSDRAEARLTRRAIGSVAIGVVLLLGVWSVVAVLVARNEDAAAEVYLLTDMRTTAARVLELAVDAETGQRGYLVTHDDAYLEPFLAASRSLDQTLAALSDRVAGDPVKHDLVRRLAAEVDGKFAELRQTIELERAGRHADALAIVNAGEGRRRMDEIRNLGTEFDTELRGRLVTAQAEQARTRHLIMVALAAAAIGIFGLSAMMVRETRRQMRKLTAARSQLRTMVRGLENRVARRTRELTEINQRFDIALQASGMSVFVQDRDLIYTWLSHGTETFPVEYVVGKSDAQILSPRSCGPVERLKRRVIETGMPARGEVPIDMDDGVHWWDLTVVPAVAADGATTGVLGGALDITARKETEQRVRLLVTEVTHRAKNLLSVIQAIMRQTAGHSATMQEFCDRFTLRLNSLAASHDLLVQQDWQGAELHDLVRSQVGHNSDPGGTQIEVEGTKLMVPPQSAQHIGMALHELASNAAKYGALSIPEGRVRVAWTVVSDGEGGRVCRLSWSESGGPPVRPPTRSGFGRTVIERTVAHALNGTVELDFATEGLRWAITFPLVV